MDQRHVQLTHLFATPHAVTGGHRADEGRQQGRLAGARGAGDDHRGRGLYHRPQELRRAGRDRGPFHHRLQRLTTQGIAPEGGREPVGDRGDHGRQSGRVVQDPSLDHGAGGVEPTIGVRQQAVDDLTVLPLRGGLIQRPQSPAGVQVAHPAPLDEHLFEIGTRQQVRERPEVGHRTHHSLQHLTGIRQRPAPAEMGLALILLDRAPHHLPDRLSVLGGVDGAFLHQPHGPTPDVLVGVVHEPNSAASPRTALRYGPGATSEPLQAASATRGSSGSMTTGTPGRARASSVSTSRRR